MPLTLEQLSARLDRVEAQLNLRPLEPSPKPPFYGHTPACGMHHLKDAWNQLKYLVPQCNWLNEELALAISATRVQAPDRPANNLGFCLAERVTQGRPQNGQERQLEWDLYNPWGLGGMVFPKSEGGLTGQDRHNAEHNLFHRLVGFQVPLFDNIQRDGWAYIDLVGIENNGDPVVIELKRLDAGDMPLRVIMEGVAYAIALKEVWPKFHAEAADLLIQHEVKISLNPEPENIHVCLLAPPDNWEAWRKNIQGNPHVGVSLHELVHQLAEMGFPLRFGSVDQALNCLTVQFP